LHTAGHLRLGCNQADSLLASPFGLVIEGSVALKLAKKLCDPPLFSAGDELLKGSGDSGFFGGLSAHAKGSIEQVLVESLSSWAPAATLVVWMALCDAQRCPWVAAGGGWQLKNTLGGGSGAWHC
jgi:hypothetical protein